jgi:hypothetical protein
MAQTAIVAQPVNATSIAAWVVKASKKKGVEGKLVVRSETSEQSVGTLRICMT